MRRASIGHAFVVAGATLWGFWALFIRRSGMSGPAVSFMAMVGMSLPALWMWKRRTVDAGSRRALWLLGVSDAANAGLYFSALAKGPVSVAVLTHYLAPILVAFCAPWVGGEARSSRAWKASMCSLAGLFLLLRDVPKGGAWQTGLLGAASAVFYACNVFTTKRACQGYTAAEVAALHSPLSALALLIVFWGQALPHVGVGSVAWIWAGGLLCGFGGTSLFNVGLASISTQTASALTYLEPLVATVVALFIFGERVTAGGVLGGLLVVAAGVYVVTERKPAPLPSHPPASLSHPLSSSDVISPPKQ